ncbi:MAG: NADH-quinone oxidoreductase subunit NuoG [Ilumatobacteraceae bacterium]|nr:NADH-quinone oxidoreductase subunit NuoG [Ilumatobacteraceae bacterium]
MSESTDDTQASDADEDVSADDVDAAVDEEVTEEPEPEDDSIKLIIDGVERRVDPGGLVIDACNEHGSYVPHFCYHPRMSPVGMCRQCLVEVEGPRGTMTVVSCMTPTADGQVVNTATPAVKRAQEGVLELLLANHPLDCPVCDKGGECPLQDQAFSHGPGESRYVEQKRHYEKPIPISDLVYLDRERCILCDRCTRFADEVAGDKLIHFVSRGNNTQVMTFPDEPFVSYFSGNTVQICPVGALTAKPYRFKARPWDLDQVESTCMGCAVGCRIVVQASRDEVIRYQGVDSDAVNWGWMCDRGRFNFEALNSDQRLSEPMIRTESGLTPTTWNIALDAAAGVLRDALATPESVGVLGGSRGTNEDAYAWAQLADVMGSSYRDAQVGDGLPTGILGYPRATINEAANASTIVLMGPDLKEELGVLYLRLRDAAEKRRSRILEFSATETGLTPYAWKSIRHEPGAQSAAVAAALSDEAIADQLAAGPVVIVAGRGNLAESPDAVIAAVDALFDAVPEATVLPALRRGNVNGALLMGMAPADDEHDALATLQAASEGRLDVLILVGSDPLSDCPDADLARRAIAGVARVISVDTHPTASTQRADVVLPASSFAEKSGTTTNLEGRVTDVNQKVTATGTSRPDWMIALDLGVRLGERSFPSDHPLRGAATVDDVTEIVASTVEGFAGASHTEVKNTVDGVVVPAHVPRATSAGFSPPPRNNYDYRLVISRKLFDDATGTQMSRSLANLAPGGGLYLNPLDVAQLGVEVGDDVTVTSAQSTVVINVAGDERVPRGIAWSPFNQAGASVGDIVDAGAGVTDVRIERAG